jgi:hypothetical protein
MRVDNTNQTDQWANMHCICCVDGGWDYFISRLCRTTEGSILQLLLKIHSCNTLRNIVNDEAISSNSCSYFFDSLWLIAFGGRWLYST